MKLPRLPTQKEIQFLELLEPVLRRIEAGNLTTDEFMFGLRAACCDVPVEIFIDTRQ